MLPAPLTLLSSILLVLSFPPWGAHFLIWVALVPWLIQLKKSRSLKDAFIEGLWLSFLMSLFGFYWVAYVLHEFAELPWPLAVVGLLLYGLIGQPQFYIFAPLWKFLEPKIKNPVIATLTFTALYTGIDWVIPKLFVDTLGHSLWTAERLRQAADLGGPMLLTFVIYWANDVIWRVWNSRLPRKQNWLKQAIAVVLTIAALLVYGQVRKTQIQDIVEKAPRTLQAAVIQANIGDFDKVAAETGYRNAADNILDKFFDLSNQALAMNPKPDVLIWPETSYPTTFRTPQNPDEFRRDTRVEDFVREHNIPILFGGYDHLKNKDYNAFFFLSPRREPSLLGPGDLQTYRKNILLLFGEFIPGAETFKFIRTAFPQVGNFGRGVGPEVLNIVQADPKKPDVPVGPIICYEALFPNYIIQAARHGSQMILNITNDSWFGPFGEPILHFSLITFRGIETRLPQLRSTNTGISALILPDGSVEKRTQIGGEEIMNARVPLTAPIPTLMKAWGDWFGPFSLIFGLFLAGFSILIGKPTQLSKS